MVALKVLYVSAPVGTERSSKTKLLKTTKYITSGQDEILSVKPVEPVMGGTDVGQEPVVPRLDVLAVVAKHAAVGLEPGLVAVPHHQNHLGVGELFSDVVPQGACWLVDHGVHIAVHLPEDGAVSATLKEVQVVVEVVLQVLLKVVDVLIAELSQGHGHGFCPCLGESRTNHLHIALSLNCLYFKTRHKSYDSRTWMQTAGNGKIK